jgi:hypothetical protein
MNSEPHSLQREPSISYSASRLYNEFTDVRSIGNGTFGSVYRYDCFLSRGFPFAIAVAVRTSSHFVPVLARVSMGVFMR